MNLIFNTKAKKNPLSFSIEPPIPQSTNAYTYFERIATGNY